MEEWINYNLLIGEISLHRENCQRVIRNYKHLIELKGEASLFELSEYKEAVGAEVRLACLEQWCQDFKFTTEEVLNKKEQVI